MTWQMTSTNHFDDLPNEHFDNEDSKEKADTPKRQFQLVFTQNIGNEISEWLTLNIFK